MVMTDSLYQTVRITAIRQEAEDVKTFIFDSDESLPYKAGQFITFVVPQEAGPEQRRSYSLASTPVLNEPLSITVKRVPNGLVSRLLHDYATVGTNLLTIGAGGLFTLPERPDHYGQLFFWAAGVGIVPIYALIKTVLVTTEKVRIVLVYSNASSQQVVFGKELAELQKKYSNRFQIQHLYSTSKFLLRARLNKSLLSDLLKEKRIVDGGLQMHYVCGPFEYRRMVLLGLEEAGIPEANVKKEIFQTHQPVYKPMPPDQNSHQVNIRLGKNVHSIRVQYPDTILQTAKKHGIQLPYSCETGRCGSCAADCTSGKVWLSYNEVLTDGEINAGKMLTCTGHPINGDVTLQF